MKIRILMLLFLGLNLEALGQNLKFGIATGREYSFSNSVVQIDSVSVFEQTEKGDYFLIPSFKIEWALSERFRSSFGVQYYRSYLSLLARYTSESFPKHSPIITKGGLTTTYNFEFPVGISYVLVKKNQFKLILELAAVPVWSIQDFEPFKLEVPQGIDWTQEILDVINAVETIPNPFYMNYQYGISMEYKRFGLTLFRSENMSRSISTDYELYGQSYNFQRRIQSTRLGLYYSLGLKKEKD
ncbi:hypothetical protein Aoki45_36710 [Algoriphagus sp. oki45]|uniref:hypothetical protein n=1 Tax=Algoriphagus sp. oki45 TaxID=3067294 RepID=UPI0027F82103|nr:hypothetical protein Aoki45_36710 [Algoriphagus sp. oki45]